MKRLQLVLLMMTAALAALGMSAPAQSCDQLASRLISNALAPAIANLGCEGLDDLGFRHPEHHLQSVCYSSDGEISRLEIVAFLRCKTGGFIEASVSDTLTARATVRGSDCQLIDVDVDASGDFGSMLIDAFDVNGKAREELQEALNDVCQ